MPATSSATSSVIAIVTRRMRKPTVPAVPGSMRRKNVGAAARPMSRASAQPSASSATTVAICNGVSHGLCLQEPLWRCVSEAGVWRFARSRARRPAAAAARRLPPGPAHRPLADVSTASPTRFPRLAARLEHPLEVRSLRDLNRSRMYRVRPHLRSQISPSATVSRCRQLRIAAWRAAASLGGGRARLAAHAARASARPAARSGPLTSAPAAGAHPAARRRRAGRAPR